VSVPYQLKRSLLYSPASRIDRVRKALEAGQADVVVADLEDGTAPGDRPAARAAVAKLLASPPKSRSLLAVRINAWPDAAARLDVDALLARPPAILVVPKVESASALGDLARTLEDAGVPSSFYAQIETARGLLEAAHIASAPRVQALIFGAEDYAASVGAVRTPEGSEVLYARSHMVACAAAAGIEAVDQIWADYKDAEGLRRDAAFGARLGYVGKQLIHPDQITPTHEAYAPTAKEVDRAQRIVAAAEKAGGGVVVVDDRMIDRPLVEQARRVLRRAQAPG
jgi:citrate lyase subunit beta / citryl-CoA lyase